MFLIYAGYPLQAQALNTPVKVSYEFKGTSFPLVHKHQATPLFIDFSDADVVKIASTALQNDIKLMTGITPVLKENNQITSQYAVIIGTIGQSTTINQLIKTNKIQASKVKGRWETFSIAVVKNPFKNVKQALVIYGRDKRGTAFGVFELCRRMRISPLVWWAEVKPTHHNAIYLTPGQSIDGPPSVKYRGIFLNDEDWGLRPWAALNMDPDKKDIGPRTYEKVFELF